MAFSDLDDLELAVDESFLDYFDDQQVAFSTFCWDVILQVWPNVWTCLISCLAWRAFRGLLSYHLSRSANPNILARNYDLLLHILSITLSTVMIVAMKAISVAAPRNRECLESVDSNFMRSYLTWCGYAFSPGSVIFGPWYSFESYVRATHLTGQSAESLWGQDLVRASISIVISVCCLIYSTYLSSILDISYFFSSRWTTAYAQSQSFRFSHYFVSFFSQSLHQVIGLSTLTHPNPKGKCVSAFIANPISVELPRSLVDVVIHWNFPMHSWLKTFIYKPTRRFGQLPALLLTYAFSSLLHGLNFQLAAVLFSIGYYAYIEYILRDKLSKLFNACIEARACPRTCPHVYKSNDWRVRLVNVFFSGLAIFHLAYLAVMFDTSDQQDEGYTMHHALKKWSDLNFLSHVVAALTYLLYRLL